MITFLRRWLTHEREDWFWSSPYAYVLLALIIGVIVGELTWIVR